MFPEDSLGRGELTLEPVTFATTVDQDWLYAISRVVRVRLRVFNLKPVPSPRFEPRKSDA